MDFSGQSTVQTQNAVFNNTINSFAPSEHASGTKHKSPKDARVRRRIAERAVKSASFNAAERGDPPKCHPDTRIAVQESLAAWRSNRAAGPVRLISGWAGTGKTTIAQTMAEYWARQGQLCGSFFFSGSSKERNTTEDVPPTILHQFLQTHGAGVDTGLSGSEISWYVLVEVLRSISSSLLVPMVIVLDGLDECSSTYQQVLLLRDILESLYQLGSSIKILISCRPERHLEDVFNEFAPKLGPSYRIQLGQSAEDNDDIRAFFRVSFGRISQHRRQDWAMSITDGPWPSHKEIEELVDRTSGQFVFASTLVRFVDDENEDPVEMLNLVLQHLTSSFEAIDRLYLVILKRVEMTLDKSTKSLERQQLMQNLILHVNYEPSSSTTIAEFWFEKEVTINILVKHLQALLVRNPDTRGQASQSLVQFRHKSFHDFLARPSAPHSFSLAEMNPVSKFFFSLRTHVGKATYRPEGWVLHRSQLLGYTFLYLHDHLPIVFPYEEAARRLHQAYAQHRPTFRGCVCLPQLEHIMLDICGLGAFKPCRQSDCVVNSDLLTLCRMMAIPHFIRLWEERERLKATSFRVLIFLLWFRVMVFGLLSDPSTAAYGTIGALMSGSSSLNWQARCLAIMNGLLCVAVLLNTRYEAVVLLHVFHAVASFLLRRFLRFDALGIEPGDSSLRYP